MILNNNKRARRIDMRKFEQMVEAHKNIYEVIGEIQGYLGDVENNAAQLAKSISHLAGMLKIHLGNEDRFLYPVMKESTDVTLQKKASDFQDEMGGLSEEFMSFKDNYNTQLKIAKDIESAKKDIDKMCKSIIERMKREDNDLYPLAKKVM